MRLSRNSLSENINCSNKKALSTPALLFYKPSQKQSEQPYCDNHRNRVAYYAGHIDDDQYIYYCDQCATLLIKQGFKVTKLTEPQKQIRMYPERQQQINDFLWCLQNVSAQMQSRKAQTKTILINSEEFYGKQIEDINEYFEVIYQNLELQKNKCYNYILQERKNAEALTRNIHQKMTQYLNDLEIMTKDIQENLAQVYTIQPQNYYLVMKPFRQKFDECSQFVTNNQVPEVQYRKIQFAGVPESINSISEIILNSVDEIGFSYEGNGSQEHFNSLMFSFEGSKIKENEISQKMQPKTKRLISQQYEYEIEEEEDNQILI